jgi:hypothetical protein
MAAGNAVFGDGLTTHSVCSWTCDDSEDVVVRYAAALPGDRVTAHWPGSRPGHPQSTVESRR